MASYLVEGGPSKEHAKTKALMFGAPEVWDALMRKIADIAAVFLETQVAAGASAIQALRLLGRRAHARRLRPTRPTALRPGARPCRRAWVCRGSTSASVRRTCST
nr:uroporphyrinogen decarboxylase family protein [Nocardioides convexus]